jgi:hypothetical protein
LGSSYFGFVRKVRTVRKGLADGPGARCSSCVLRVLARLRFRSVVFSSFGWARFWTVRVCREDSPRVRGGQSACSSRTVHYSGFATGGSVGFNGQSAWLVQTVRPTWPDGPPEPDCFALWFDSSLLSFVLLRVIQGIVPKT